MKEMKDLIIVLLCLLFGLAACLAAVATGTLVSVVFH